jgi:hypothetical protein
MPEEPHGYCVIRQYVLKPHPARSDIPIFAPQNNSAASVSVKQPKNSLSSAANALEIHIPEEQTPAVSTN